MSLLKRKSNTLIRRVIREWQALPLIAALGIVIIGWVSYLSDSPVPNVDFYGFYWAAHALHQCELPQNFKRAPLLVSLLIPLASEEVPSPMMITVARVISLLGYLVFGVALYAFLRRFCPRFAVLIVLLYLLNPHYLLFVALQPIADSWLAAGAMLGCLGVLTGGRILSWLSGMIACSARYDGVSLLPMLMWRFGADWKRWHYWGGLVAAVLPTALWLLMGWYHTGHPSPYVRETEESGSSGWRFIAVVGFTLFANFLPQPILDESRLFQLPNLVLLVTFGIGIAGAIGLGLVRLYREGHRHLLVQVGLFFTFYLVLHMGFAASLPRYTFPLNWFFFWALGVLLQAIYSSGASPIHTGVLLLMGVGILGGLLLGFGSFSWLLLVPLIMFCFVGGEIWERFRWKTILVLLAAYGLSHNLFLSANYWRDEHLLRNAELMEFARWYRSETNKRKIATFNWAQRYLIQYERLPKEKILTIPRGYQKNPEEWFREQGVDLILWNETELYFERVAPLNPTYGHAIRRAYGSVGIRGSYIHRVQRGDIKGWRIKKEFLVRGRRAVLYERVSNP